MTPHRTAELWEKPDGGWYCQLFYTTEGDNHTAYSVQHHSTLGAAKRAAHDWAKDHSAYLTMCVYRYGAPKTTHADYSEDDDAD